MGTDTEIFSEPETAPSARALPPLVVVVLVLCAAAIGAGAALLWTLGGQGQPADGSAEAGFARDMAAHHAQAVDMSTTVLTAGVGPEVRTLAYDIITSQGAQRGMLLGWLQRWDLPATRVEQPMGWATSNPTAGMDHSASPAPSDGSGGMPGMAPPADVRRLAQSRGREAEGLYLQLMIRHHQGGVAMAKAALDLVEDEDERRLARTIVEGQTAEIELMRSMLERRGAAAS